jgi:hypothetical protein
MQAKENKTKKNPFFHIPPEDRIEFELEDIEKEEKELASEKILKKPENTSKE